MFLNAGPGVASLIPAQSHTFVEINHEIICTAILLPFADSRRVVFSYKFVYKVDWDVKNQTIQTKTSLYSRAQYDSGFKDKNQGCRIAFIMPHHDNGRGIKCYCSPSVCPYLLTYLSTYLLQRRLLLKSNTFDQNFMKLGHIV